MTVYIRVYVSMEFIVYSRHNNIPDMCKYTLSLDKYTQSTKIRYSFARGLLYKDYKDDRIIAFIKHLVVMPMDIFKFRKDRQKLNYFMIL